MDVRVFELGEPVQQRRVCRRVLGDGRSRLGDVLRQILQIGERRRGVCGAAQIVVEAHMRGTFRKALTVPA